MVEFDYIKVAIKPSSLLFALCGFLVGCSPVSFDSTSDLDYSSTNPQSVDVLHVTPYRSYETLGTVHTSGYSPTETQEMYNDLRDKAAYEGADAVIIKSEGYQNAGSDDDTFGAQGELIHYTSAAAPPPPSANSASVAPSAILDPNSAPSTTVSLSPPAALAAPASTSTAPASTLNMSSATLSLPPSQNMDSQSSQTLLTPPLPAPPMSSSTPQPISLSSEKPSSMSANLPPASEQAPTVLHLSSPQDTSSLPTPTLSPNQAAPTNNLSLSPSPAASPSSVSVTVNVTLPPAPGEPATVTTHQN